MSPYPVLISNVVVPCARSSATKPARRRAQLVVGRGAGRGDRAAYAAGGIRRAGHARLELVRPVAAEHEVRVAVDEPGDDGPAAGIDDLAPPRRPARLHRRRDCGRALSRSPLKSRRRTSALGRRADPRDAAALDEDRGIRHRAARVAVAATLVVSSPMFVISVGRSHRAIASQHRHLQAALAGDLLRAVVAGVDVAHDARARVVGEHALELLGGERRAVGDGHLTGMDGAADADAAAVVDRHPRGARSRC